MINSIPIVYPNNEIASFFFPSIYNIIGFPNTKNPVIAAEHTNSRSIAIGIIIMSRLLSKKTPHFSAEMNCNLEHPKNKCQSNHTF